MEWYQVMRDLFQKEEVQRMRAEAVFNPDVYRDAVLNKMDQIQVYPGMADWISWAGGDEMLPVGCLIEVMQKVIF